MVANTQAIRASMQPWDQGWARVVTQMLMLTPARPWDQGNLASGLTRDQARELGNRGSDIPLDHHTNRSPIRPILSLCSSRQGSRASLCTP